MINVYHNSIDDRSGADHLYQSPSGNNIIGECRFFFSEEEIKKKKIKIDFIVVYNRCTSSNLLKKINLKNTLLIAMEPPSVHSYKDKYTNQFEHVFCSDPTYSGLNKKQGPFVTPWSVGQRRTRIGLVNYKNSDEITFSNLKKMIFKKKKLISVIETSKRLCKEQIIRNDIIQSLKNEFPSYIDSFGRDTNHIEDKLDALKDYHYHICISNYWGKDHIDEKLYDPLIARCNPIYLGCKNIKDYFNTEFYKLNPSSLSENISLVKKIINKEKHFFEFETQRDQIFSEMNYFTFLSNFIKKNFSSEKKIGNIEPENKIFNYKIKLQKILSNLCSQ